MTQEFEFYTTLESDVEDEAACVGGRTPTGREDIQMDDLFSQGLVKLITWCTLQQSASGVGGPGFSLGTAVFLALAAATLYNFLQAALEGPGFVPERWRPEIEGDTAYLQYCSVCEGYKAPRSHHCKKCGRCVLKMDHHCPWINSCVGHRNHAAFVRFLAAATTGCGYATVALSTGVWRSLLRPARVSLVPLLLALLALGLSLGVMLAVGALLYLQIRGIIRNQTTIEDWIVEKAAARGSGLVFPYRRGWRRLRALGAGDGLRWELRDGCGPYDLCLEQMEQKREKRSRACRLVAARAYQLRWDPRLWLAAPCAQEPRLLLAAGDRLCATRQRGNWYYGEKLLPSGSEGAGAGEGAGEGAGVRAARGPRGWFPKSAVVPAPEEKQD